MPPAAMGRPKERSRCDATLALFLTALVAGGLGGAVFTAVAGGDDSPSVSSAPAQAATAQARDAGLSPEQVYRDAAPGVVVITATQTQEVPPTFFAPAQKEQVRSLGSGFVLDKRGDVVTNDHVVAGRAGSGSDSTAAARSAGMA